MKHRNRTVEHTMANMRVLIAKADVPYLFFVLNFSDEIEVILYKIKGAS